MVRPIDRRGQEARRQDGSRVLSHSGGCDLRLGVNEGCRKRLRDLTPGPTLRVRRWGWPEGLHTDWWGGGQVWGLVRRLRPDHQGLAGAGGKAPRPRSPGRTGQWCGRWRTFRTWLCSGSPSASTLSGSTGQKETLGSLCWRGPHLPPHPSPAGPWPRTPYLVQGTDFVLAFNIVFIICKDFKPGGERAGRKLPEVKAEPIRSWWTPGGLESDAASLEPCPALLTHPALPSPAAPPARPPGRLAHRSWCMSMLTMSLNRSGCLGEKKPLLSCSMTWRSSGIRS